MFFPKGTSKGAVRFLAPWQLAVCLFILQFEVIPWQLDNQRNKNEQWLQWPLEVKKKDVFFRDPFSTSRIEMKKVLLFYSNRFGLCMRMMDAWWNKQPNLECFFINQNDSFVRTTWTVTQCHGESLKVNGGPTVKHLIPPPYNNKRQRLATTCLSGHSLSAISQATLGLTSCTISFVTQHDYCCTTHSFSDSACRSCNLSNVFHKVRERTTSDRWLCL